MRIRSVLKRVSIVLTLSVLLSRTQLFVLSDNTQKTAHFQFLGLNGALDTEQPDLDLVRICGMLLDLLGPSLAWRFRPVPRHG